MKLNLYKKTLSYSSNVVLLFLTIVFINVNESIVIKHFVSKYNGLK